MLKKFWFWLKKVYKNIRRIFSPKEVTSSMVDAQASMGIINDKIKLLGGEKDAIKVIAYQKYFDFLEKLGLREDFNVITAHDGLSLYATIFRPLLISKNNNKMVIFCHGLTNNRWSLFYTMHLALQRGYQDTI